MCAVSYQATPPLHDVEHGKVHNQNNNGIDVCYMLLHVSYVSV